jgi:hypothetical protein
VIRPGSRTRSLQIRPRLWSTPKVPMTPALKPNCQTILRPVGDPTRRLGRIMVTLGLVVLGGYGRILKGHEQ